MKSTSEEILNLSNPLNNLVATVSMDNEVSNLGAAILYTQIYSTVVLQQAIFVAGNIQDKEIAQIIKELSDRQEQAKKDAQEYLNSLSSSLIGAIVGINGYAVQFSAFAQAIESLLPKFVNESTRESARGQIIGILTALEIDAQKKLDSVQKLVSSLETYQQRIKGNAENLKKLIDKAEKVITDDSGELKRIQNEIGKTQDKIAGQIAGVTISALVVVGGAVVIVLGATGTVVTGGGASASSVPVVLAGVSLLASGATGLTTMSIQLAESNKKLADLYKQAAELNSTLLILQHVNGLIEPLEGAVSNIEEGISGISNEWSSLLTGIGEFKKLLERANASDVFYLESSFSLAASSWQSVAKSVENIEQTLTSVSTKQVEDITSVLITE